MIHVEGLETRTLRNSGFGHAVGLGLGFEGRYSPRLELGLLLHGDLFALGLIAVLIAPGAAHENFFWMASYLCAVCALSPCSHGEVVPIDSSNAQAVPPHT